MKEKIIVFIRCTNCENEDAIKLNGSGCSYVEIYTRARRICLECGHDMDVVVEATTTNTKTKIISRRQS